MKDDFRSEATAVEETTGRETSDGLEHPADERCAIIPGQIGHLLQKGFSLGMVQG